MLSIISVSHHYTVSSTLLLFSLKKDNKMTDCKKDGRYFCKFCSKSFNSIEGRQQHVKAVHDGEKLKEKEAFRDPEESQFKMIKGKKEKIEKASRDKLMLQKTHKMKEVMEDNQNERKDNKMADCKKDGRYFCKTCSKSFNSIEGRQQHVKAVHNGEKLKEKEAFRNPDEFQFKMVKGKKEKIEKVSRDKLSLQKTHKMKEVMEDIKKQRKITEEMTVSHHLRNPPSNKHIYSVKDRQEAEKMKSKISVIDDTSDHNTSELKAKEDKLKKLIETYNDLAMQKELMKGGPKRQLRQDEISVPTKKPVYKWKKERKR